MQEISEVELKLSSFFTELTKVLPIITVAVDNGVAFVVDKKDIAKAIGKDGKNVKIMTKRLNKQVYIFANSNNLEQFIKNILADTKILALETNKVMDETYVTAFIPDKDKAKVIGKKKARIKLIEELIKRKFNANFYLRSKVI